MLATVDGPNMPTTDRRYVLLDSRGILSIAGSDARNFLQGLVSNDIRRLASDQALYAAFLTPQGKYLHDFFLVEHGPAILLDGEAARLTDLCRRLSIYRLRSDVTLSVRSEEFRVAALIGDGVAAAVGLPAETGRATGFGGGVAFVDPRLVEAGVRVVLPREDGPRVLEAAGFTAAADETYERLRIGLGLPDGSRDMAVEKAILLENGFDELHGVDWNKGCYLGQELTARTKYRGLVKKRLIPVVVDGELPEPGTPVLFEGTEAGEIRTGTGGNALALLRLDCLQRAGESGGVFLAGEARLTPRRPDWAAF